MNEPLPQPVLDLQTVLGGAEITLKRIVTEVAAARERAAPLVPAELDLDDASEVPGVDGWAQSLDGSAQQLITTLCESALVGLDRARRSSPAEPSPEPRPWVGEQILAATRLPTAGFQPESEALGSAAAGLEAAG